MATLESIKQEQPEGYITRERVRLALEASWEAESCAEAALNVLENADPEYMAARSLVIRLRGLSHIIMSALGDERDDPTRLREQLTGLHVQEEASHG